MLNRFLLGFFVLLISVVAMQSTVDPESFVLDAQDHHHTSESRRRKSIGVLREELMNAFEDLAHRLLKEIMIISDILSAGLHADYEKCVDAKDARYENVLNLINFLHEKQEAMQPACTGAPASLFQLIRLLAEAQDRLLVIVKDLLEDNTQNTFCIANKRQLKKNIVAVKQYVRESALHTSSLQKRLNKSMKKNTI